MVSRGRTVFAPTVLDKLPYEKERKTGAFFDSHRSEQNVRSYFLIKHKKLKKGVTKEGKMN